MFSYKNPQLEPNANFLLDYAIAIPTSAKYLPFNFLQITNNAEGDIEVWIDDDVNTKKTIPRGTIMTFENIWFRKVRIVNISPNILSQNKIEITSQRLPIKPELARTPDMPIIQKIKLFWRFLV